MNNLIPQINLINMGEVILNDKVVNGVIKDFPDALQNIKTNQEMFLKVITDSDMLNLNTQNVLKVFVSSMSKTDNVILDLNLDKNISLPKNVESEIVAKVISNNGGDIKIRLTSINNEPPDKFVVKSRSQINTSLQSSTSIKPEILEGNAKKPDITKNETIIKSAVDIKNIADIKKIAEFRPSVEITPIKLEKIVSEIKSYISASFPKAEVEQITQEMSNIALKFELVDSAKDVASKNFTANVKNVLQKLDLSFENDTAKIVEQVKTSLENLKDGFIKAAVDRAIDGKNFVVKTPLGAAILKSDVKITLEKELVLSLKEVVVLENKSKPLPLKEVVADILKNINPKHVEIFSAKIPDISSPKFVANFISYTKSAIAKDISAWLGKEIVEEISSRSVEGREVISRLSNMISSNTREVGLWRIVEVPFMIDSNLKSIKIAVKKKQDDESKKNKNKNNGYRFIIDTAFTALGEIQFDGYATPKNRNFDLIIRTQNDIGEDLCSNIMRIFNNVLVSIDYVGRIKININESFVKVIEEQCLADGVYI